MPLLPTRPNSLCLLCASTLRPRLQPQRLLPHTQVAHRIGSRIRKKQKAYETRQTSKEPKGSDPISASRKSNRLHYNPLSKPRGFPFRLFQSLRLHLDDLKKELGEPAFLETFQLNPREFDEKWLSFERRVALWIKQAPPDLVELANDQTKEQKSLLTRLRQMFYGHIYESTFTKAEFENQNKVADLRYPAEWFPATREIARTVHMHVGPTNSGKTYHALKRLEEAKSGIYLGPLRLLAHEVYTRLNAKGKPCALVTGEEQRIPEGKQATMFSCTVEMAPLNTAFEVAVIDEIQMISHKERGWAWTQAFFGLQAKEIHLCGEARTVPLMREFCALVGDKIHIHEYQRLTPLKVEPRSLGGNLRKLQKGDCIVAFTVLGIHTLRREIEKKTGKKCAIVYGSLPPETRAQQARLFNDPDNDYDFLVASDAIGMGLNLAVKRIILESTMKYNGISFVPLQISELKQIAGRAGRYKTAHEAVSKHSEQNVVIAAPTDPAIDLDDQRPVEAKAEESQVVGWVTTFQPEDLVSLSFGMNQEPEPIKTAGIFPPSLIVERFASYFPPDTPFSYILTRLNEISEIHPRFHLCELKDQLAIADTIHMIKNLNVQDRIVICAAPLSMRFKPERTFLQRLADCIANGRSGNLLDLDILPLNAMDQTPTRGQEYLYSLERLHKMLVCYLWLSYRFPNALTTRALANYTKQLVEEKIESALTEFGYTEGAIERIRKVRAQRRKELDAHASQDQSEHPKHDHASEAPKLSENVVNIINNSRKSHGPPASKMFG